MRKITLLFVSLLLAGAQMLQAQRTITGTVLADSDKQGIPGVSVKVKGTTTGTTTDINGRYNVSAPNSATVLVFSFMGMATQEVSIDGKTTIDVIMLPSATALEGVEVSGYGIKRKVAFTGSSAQVNEELLTNRGEANVISSLQGQMPGLQVSQSQGKAGSASTVRVRGLGSISAGTQPLYVIDGVPIDYGGYGISAETQIDPLSALNSEDVENISVLKDATATSIYGSRGSNGVIVVTTKRGRSGKSNINISYKEGVTMRPVLTHRFTPLNQEDYLNLMTEGIMNRFNASRDDAYATLMGQANMDPSINTNWWDEVTRPGTHRDLNVSVSGGNDKTTYFISGGFFKDNGFLIAQNFNRYSGRVNLDHRANKVVKVGMNVSGGYIDRYDVNGGYAYSAPLFSFRRLRPTDAVLNPDGSYNTGSSFQGYNPVGEFLSPNASYDQLRQYKASIVPYVQLNLWDGLIFQSKMGIDFNSTINKQYATSDNVGNPNSFNYGGWNDEQMQNFSTVTIVNTLNYMKNFGIHNINVLLGQEAQKFHSKTLWGQGIGFASPYFKEMSSTGSQEAGGGYSEAAIASYFLSAEYDLYNKYYISGSLRRDGSSRFDENKWGNFWSVGAKWRFSEEGFMKSIANIINNATLRASIGTTGNQEVGYYQAQGTFQGGANYLQIPGNIPGTIGVPDLTWEKKRKFNVGLDMSLFNRITFELDYYNEYTYDLLLAKPVSAVTGFNSYTTNFGAMRNSGVEFNFNALLVRTKDFSWTLGFNITKNKNVIERLVVDNLAGGSLAQRTIGRPYNSYFVAHWAGADPSDGAPLWYTDASHSATTRKYSEAKRDWAGVYDADFYGGFNTRLEYKGIELSAIFSYSVGGEIFGNDPSQFEHDGANGFINTTYYQYENRWTPENTNTLVPRFSYGDIVAGGTTARGGTALSTRYIMPGDYLKLRNLTLAYNLPKAWIAKAAFTKIRIFASADNMLTIAHKDFRGYDPEAGLGGSQAASYPIPRKFSLGITLGF